MKKNEVDNFPSSCKLSPNIKKGLVVSGLTIVQANDLIEASYNISIENKMNKIAIKFIL